VVATLTHNVRNHIQQGLQTYLQEGQISCNATVRGPDFLSNVIVSRYYYIRQINKCFVKILFSHHRQNVFAGRIRPGALVWRHLIYRNLEIRNVSYQNTFCVAISNGVSRLFSSLGLECLGLEGFRSRSRALSLETLHESFFMKSCKKQLLKNGFMKYLFKIQLFKAVSV